MVDETRGKAQVFCVIVGFATFDVETKRLYDYDTPDAEPMMVLAHNISPYLIDGQDFVIPTCNSPICDVPEMVKGSQPADDGELALI